MRNGNLLFSAVQFLMITALFGLALIFFGLHGLSGIRLQLAEWILENTDRFFNLGCLILCLALLLTICFLAMQKNQYLRVEMKFAPFYIDEGVIKMRIKKFWEEEFYTKEIAVSNGDHEPRFSHSKLVDVYFSHQKIEIIAQGSLENLEQIEYRLGQLLLREFGYQKEFFVTLTPVD